MHYANTKLHRYACTFFMPQTIHLFYLRRCLFSEKCLINFTTIHTSRKKDTRYNGSNKTLVFHHKIGFMSERLFNFSFSYKIDIRCIRRNICKIISLTNTDQLRIYFPRPNNLFPYEDEGSLYYLSCLSLDSWFNTS